jgi:hypothetical protein
MLEKAMEQRTLDRYRRGVAKTLQGGGRDEPRTAGCWKDTTRVLVHRMVTETLEKIPLNSSKDPPEYWQRSP